MQTTAHKRILVTGGCGFIGSNFIRRTLLTKGDCHITNLDKLTYCGNQDNLKDLAGNERYTFVQGDIADAKVVNKLVKSTDIIVNFAAETHVDRSIKDPASFVRTNVFGTYTLLEAARKADIQLFVQISTDEVYGSIEKGVFREDDPLRPNSPYSASKAGGDLLARSYFVTFGLPVIITRSSNNFGPYQYPEKVIPLFITNVMEDRQVPLYGDGKNVRDWLFVIDNCEAIDVVIRKGKPGEVYTIGGGCEITNLELTHTILELLGKGKDLIKYVPDRLGHDRRYALDIAKMGSLGWRPRHDFRTALKYTIEWYKNNTAWWKRLIACREAEAAGTK